jgi:hypothetical protein
MIFRKQILFPIFIIVLITGFWFSSINATPELSLWSGNRCSTCHINLQGGAMRNEFGWKFSKESTTFSLMDETLGSIYSFDKSKYSYFDSLFAFGFDTRVQTTRSHKTDNSVRKYYPMQASLYLNSNPTKGIMFEGQYNFGNMIFPGQSQWMASMIIGADPGRPYFRIGRFQPSMGIRDCDMTILDKRIAVPDGTESFIPPDYAEYGAEIIYESFDWLSVNLGVFTSDSLNRNTIYGSDASLIGEPHSLSYNAKVTFYPEWLWDDFPAAFIGASLLSNFFPDGSLNYYNIFLGYALMDNVYLQARFAGTQMKGKNSKLENIARSTQNWIAGVTYMPYKGIFIGLRAEHGNSNLETGNIEYYDFNTTQIVANVKFLPVPFFEIIPEYRFIDCFYYKSSRWAMQLHLYY